MTDKSAAAIREFVDKWGFSQDKTDEGFLIDNDRTKQCLSDLTALISEGYYPKEFLFWLLNGYTFLKSDQSFVVNYPYMTEHNDYRHFTSDELYQYWKENEQ
jgi:DNA modification methylase